MTILAHRSSSSRGHSVGDVLSEHRGASITSIVLLAVFGLGLALFWKDIARYIKISMMEAMHELSIALSLLEMAEQEAQRRGAPRVAALHIRLGPLSGVVKEALLSAFELAREGTPLDACELVVQEMPLVIFCSRCQAERSAISPQMLCCAACGEVAEHVVSGRELELHAMEIVDESAHATG